MGLLRKRNFYQVLTVFIWFAFISITLITGKLQIYINKRFFPFTILASFLLLIMLFIKIKRFKKEGSEMAGIISTLSFLIFLFPVLLAIVVRPDNLPVLAAAKRGISQAFTGGDIKEILQAQLETEGKYKKLNIKQLLTLAKNKPEEIDGKDISVEGFVLKNQDTEKFTLVRFLITCCAADATPLGVDVEYTDTGKLKQNSWVKVYGRCSLTEGKATILADEVKETQPPANVYLY